LEKKEQIFEMLKEIKAHSKADKEERKREKE
jgi:hypothetical protein